MGDGATTTATTRELSFAPRTTASAMPLAPHLPPRRVCARRGCRELLLTSLSTKLVAAKFAARRTVAHVVALAVLAAMGVPQSAVWGMPAHMASLSRETAAQAMRHHVLSCPRPTIRVVVAVTTSA